MIFAADPSVEWPVAAVTHDSLDVYLYSISLCALPVAS